jgi:hypothetical protein
VTSALDQVLQEYLDLQLKILHPDQDQLLQHELRSWMATANTAAKSIARAGLD